MKKKRGKKVGMRQNATNLDVKQVDICEIQQANTSFFGVCESNKFYLILD